MKITAVSDLIINGNDAMFHCNSSSMISNSMTVQILKATIINCGCTLSNFTKPNNLFPSFVMAAIIIENSSTMTITNIIFQNSPGYAIIGVNVTGESYLENLNVLHANYINPLHSKQNLQMAGGIVLIYPKTDKFNNNDITNDINMKLIIKNCNVSNISNSTEIQNSENNTIPLHQLSVAIGLIFHQQLNYTEIQIHGSIVANITSVNGPIFFSFNAFH